MLPVLFEVGPFAVGSYGVMVAVALLAAGWVLRAELDRRADRGEAALALTLAAGLGGFVGARLYWLAEHAGEITLLDSFSSAGFTWYGGVLGGAVAVLAVARRRGVDLPVLLGAAGPALALGYGVGRVACQLAGDGTYGVASDLPWAMSYPDGEVPTTEQVHPTPVYETVASLVIFWVLWRLRCRWAPTRLFGLYLILAGAERFLVELLRLNDDVALGLTQPQLFAAAMTIAGAALVARRTSTPASPPTPRVVRARELHPR